MTDPEGESKGASRGRTPSLRLAGTKVPGLYHLSGTRDGYATLSRHFASLAASAPGEYAFQSPKWEQLADELESAFASGPQHGSVLGCVLVDEIHDEPIPRPVPTLKDRLGLLGCVAAGLASLAVFGILIRGLVALRGDLS